jgi:hypothetical protein
MSNYINGDWKCDNCEHDEQVNHKMEHGDYYYECGLCDSQYINDCLTDATKGARCSFCGEWVEEVKEINFGGSKPDMVCRECEEEANG